VLASHCQSQCITGILSTPLNNSGPMKCLGTHPWEVVGCVRVQWHSWQLPLLLAMPFHLPESYNGIIITQLLLVFLIATWEHTQCGSTLSVLNTRQQVVDPTAASRREVPDHPMRSLTTAPRHWIMCSCEHSMPPCMINTHSGPVTGPVTLSSEAPPRPDSRPLVV